jgi:hypothetical protein
MTKEGMQAMLSWLPPKIIPSKNEREAVAWATERALRQTREEWLPTLEAWRAKSTDLLEQVLVDGEIRRLRRLLGIISRPGAAAAADARRVATRERVRRHRERKRAASQEIEQLARRSSRPVVLPRCSPELEAGEQGVAKSLKDWRAREESNP